MSLSPIDLQTQIIRGMSPEQKLKISQSLREFAWELKAAWIRSNHPEMTEPDVQSEVRKLFRDAGA